MQFTCYRMPLFFSATVSDLCPCRFQMHFNFNLLTKRTCILYKALPKGFHSLLYGQHSLEIIFSFYFTGKKRYTVLFYWRDTDTDTIRLKFCALKRPSTFRYKFVPDGIFGFTVTFYFVPFLFYNKLSSPVLS